MGEVIDFAASRQRASQADVSTHPILQALDALALALVDHHHVWTERERQLYETAVSYLCGGCTGSD